MSDQQRLQEASSGSSNLHASAAPTTTQDSLTPLRSNPNRDGGARRLVSKFERLELDRFIPNRSTTNWDYASSVLTGRLSERSFGEIKPGMSELHVMYTLKLKKELGIDTSRIFYYRNNRKPPEEVNYAPRKSWSVIEGQKITAPGLVADQSYLNLMDWGMRNVIAVGLRERVCFYDTDAGKKSVGFNYGDELVSSVSWCPEGLDALAIGLKNSLVHLLDPNTNQAIRTFDSWGVGSLAWNGRILTTGSRDGHIVNYDVRVGTQVARLRKSHRRAICGLKWSASGQLLASGGSDNVVHVWDARSMPTRWLHKLEDHNAAVRAVAWCPLKRHLLASGGGQGDHYIRLWDASSGTPHENAVDTGSEVCGLLWSKHYQDILFSSHGFGVSESVPDNRLILWRSPVLFKLDEIDLQYDHPRLWI